MTDDAEIYVLANRAAQKWTRREQAGRVLWAAASPLFRLSPRALGGCRRGTLRLFRAWVGRNVVVYLSVRIAILWNLTLGDNCAVGDHATLYSLGPITLGSRTTVSQYAHLCVGNHYWRDRATPFTKPPIVLGAYASVYADAFVGPGVNETDGAILGARAVVMKDVAVRAIVVGSTARFVGTRAA